eukprot:3355289-Rhodomonas_salina.1
MGKRQHHQHQSDDAAGERPRGGSARVPGAGGNPAGGPPTPGGAAACWGGERGEREAREEQEEREERKERRREGGEKGAGGRGRRSSGPATGPQVRRRVLPGRNRRPLGPRSLEEQRSAAEGSRRARRWEERPWEERPWEEAAVAAAAGVAEEARCSGEEPAWDAA